LQSAAKKVAENVVHMMSQLSALVVEDQQPGDEPVSISNGKLSLDARKTRASELNNQRAESHIGSMVFRGALRVSSSECVATQVFFEIVLYRQLDRETSSWHIIIKNLPLVMNSFHVFTGQIHGETSS